MIVISVSEIESRLLRLDARVLNKHVRIIREPFDISDIHELALKIKKGKYKNLI